MKKAYWLIAGLCMVAWSACNQGARENKQAANVGEKQLTAPVKPVYTTLTNIDRKDAVPMIKQFELDGYKRFTVQEKTWFHIDTTIFKAMIRMLYKELNSEPSALNPVDGFRIYMIQDPKSPAEPLFTIVATRDSSVWHRPNDPSSVHKDYYLHDFNDPFYHLSNYTVLIGHDDDSRGAGLYIHNNGPEPGCPPTVNDVSRSLAETMLNDFGASAGGHFTTRSAWYPLRMFENFDKTTFTGGIRFYLSNRDYEGESHRNTFIMVPTDKGTGSQKFADNYSCYKFHLTRITPRDNGELCPNHCN